jgi:hypothetical protein
MQTEFGISNIFNNIITYLQCAMKYIYSILGPSLNLLFGLFFWTLPDYHPPFPRCHKVDLYFTP